MMIIKNTSKKQNFKNKRNEIVCKIRDIKMIAFTEWRV